MDRIWAPWRGQYVAREGEQTFGCFLCDAGCAEHADAVRGIVSVAKHSVTLLNRFPYASGHVMVAPKVHGGDILTLDVETYHCMMESVRHAVHILTKVYRPHGLNIGMNLGMAAGAGVPDHCHIHIVPRWEGDVNFMPVVGGVKVVSEDLSSSWERLHDAFAAYHRENT